MPSLCFLSPKLALVACIAISASAAFGASIGNDPGNEFGMKGCEPHEHFSSCWNRQGQARAGEESKRAADRASNLEKSALQRAELSDQIGTDRDALGSRLNQLTNLEPNDALRQKNNILNQAYKPQPPKDASQSSRSMAESMRKLGLNSQRDLWQKGAEVQASLQESAKKEAQESANLFRQAQLGQQAGQNFGKMAEISRQRQEGIKSIPATGAMVSSQAGIGAPDDAGTTRAGSSEAGRPGGKVSGLSKGETGETGKWDKASLTAALAKAKNDPKAKKSLRDQLRAALAAAKAKGDSGAAGQIESAIATLEKPAEGKAAEGNEGRALASLGASLPASSSGFTMNSDDERAVKSTIDEFERALIERSSPAGTDDRTLFERVSVTLQTSFSAGRIR